MLLPRWSRALSSSVVLCAGCTSADSSRSALQDASFPADGGPGGTPVPQGASVTQFHKNASRDGLYVDPLFTKAAAAAIHRDTSFASAPIAGPVYAQRSMSRTVPAATT
jgi:hypothetical protein